MAVRRLLVGAGSLLAAFGVLGLIELALRQTELRAEAAERFHFVSTFPRKSQARFIRAHPTRFYELRADYRQSADHLGRYANSSWPFRGRPPEPAPDAQRVVLLGDSCVFGIGLPTSETLSHELQEALEAAGFGPRGLQVLNFGVPGYSTVQMRILLKEVLAEVEPDLVVLYPAAWNDQAPALGRNDVALRTEALQRTWLRPLHESAIWAALNRLTDRRPDDRTELVQDVIDRWQKEQVTLLGTRVPEEELQTELLGMLNLCASQETPVLVVAPAHPAPTARRYPNTRRYAARVIEAARQAEVPWVDAQDVLVWSGLSDEEFFLDHVHMAPGGTRALAEAIAPAVASWLQPSEAPTACRLVRSVEPERASQLGDERIRIELDGPLESRDTPSILVGGAPLAGVVEESPGVFTGELPENAPGPHDIWIQTEHDWVDAAQALFLEPLRLQAVQGSHGSLVAIRAHARPGDRVVLYGSTSPRERPRWTKRGPEWLPVEDLEVALATGTASADGFYEFSVPQADPRVLEGLWLQALVLPRGQATGGAAARWSQPWSESNGRPSIDERRGTKAKDTAR